MRYEWDEEKRRSNLAKHGLDFADVERLYDWSASVAVDDDVIDFELRCRDIGKLGTRIVVLVWTQRDDRVRVISLRLASARERRFYVGVT